MRTIRSFLALDLSLPTARALADLQRALAGSFSQAGVDVRFVAPQNMHVTIAFLGQVAEPMVKTLSSVLAPAAAAVPPFEMTCAGLGVFPQEDRPRVLWAGVSSPAGELERLHSKVAGILEETGFCLDDRPFRSHVTIGRVPDSDPAALASCLLEHTPDEFGRTSVRDLACYRSDLDPRGADYHLLWRLPLAGRATEPEPSEKE